MTEIRFSDLVLRSEPAAEEGRRERQARPRNASAFEVAACSGADFAVRRTTAKTSRLLVVLVSQGQYYAKDEITGDIRALDEDALAWALDGLSEPLPVECGWLEALPRSKAERAMFISQLRRPGFEKLARSGMMRLSPGMLWRPGVNLPTEGDSRLGPYYFDAVERIVVEKPALAKSMVELIRGRASAAVEEATLASAAALSRVESVYGLDRARYFLGRYADYVEDLAGLSPTYPSRQLGRRFETFIYEEYLRRLLGIVPDRDRLIRLSQQQRRSGTELRAGDEAVSFDVVRLCDYLFGTSLHEGCAHIGHWITTWADTLEMQVMVSGKVTDKYPRSLSTAHDILSLEVACLQAEVDAELWDAAEERMAGLDFEPAGSPLAMTHPKGPDDLRAEGAALGHCVASYVGRVIDGRSLVLFCRRSSARDTPLFTVEVSPEDMSLVQVKGRHNSAPTPEAMEFVRLWCREKGISPGPYAREAAEPAA